MKIKAIETRYKGYRFRSRLEARWAVFFDALCIEWEYEREGFVLPYGPYLPDFWLPQGNRLERVARASFAGVWGDAGEWGECRLRGGVSSISSEVNHG